MAAERAQTLKLERRGGAITTAQLTRTPLCGAGSELSDAGVSRVLLRTNGEGSRPVEMPFRLTHVQIAIHYRNDRTCR